MLTQLDCPTKPPNDGSTVRATLLWRCSKGICRSGDYPQGLRNAEIERMVAVNIASS
jgi:hypothetical protein